MDDATSSAPDTAALGTFVTLSTVLTGYAREVLAPPLDSIDLKSLYFRTAEAAQGATFDDLLAEFAAIEASTPPEGWPEAVEARILADDALGPAARQVLKLWFTGIWYDPADQVASGRIVSSQAYVGGLIWDTIQAHPPGDSQLGFGYWAELPPPAGMAAGEEEESAA